MWRIGGGQNFERARAMREEAAKRRGKNLPTAIAPDWQRSRLAIGRQEGRLPLNPLRKDLLLLQLEDASLVSALQGALNPISTRATSHLPRNDIHIAHCRCAFVEGIDVGAP